MSVIEQLIWLLNKIKWITILWSGNPYLYNMRIKFNDTGEIVDEKDLVPVHKYGNGILGIMIPEIVVDYMRVKSTFDNSKTNEDYMKAYVRRAVINSNQDIRATSEVEFFSDLISNKHIEILLL